MSEYVHVYMWKLDTLLSLGWKAPRLEPRALGSPWPGGGNIDDSPIGPGKPDPGKPEPGKPDNC